ncbi:MAG: hypothetical protein ABIQ11_03210 [Saprospiraceae bacterium]
MKKVFMIILGISVFLIFPGASWSQGFLKRINPDDYSNNFSAMAKEINMFYDTATAENRAGRKQWKRWEWFANHHLDQQGQLLNYLEENTKGIAEMKQIESPASRMPSSGAWSNLGHSVIGGSFALHGRVNSVAFDPVNANIIYVATAGGGIWKSFNNGDTWSNLTIDLPTLGIAEIVVSPVPNNHILYALTGDGEANIYQHSSVGVIKSYDSGQTWTRTSLIQPLDQSLRGYRLLMHPADPNTLLAAMSDGIHRSTDAGNTWQVIAFVGHVNDMEFDLNNLDTLYYTSRNSNTFSKLNLETLNTTNISIDLRTNDDAFAGRNIKIRFAISRGDIH